MGLDFAVQRAASAYASYSFVRIKGTSDYPYRVDENSPRHKIGAGVRLELPVGVYATVDAQYFGPSEVARIPQMPTTSPNPFERTELEDFVMSHVRLGYALSNGLDVSVAAANVLDDRTLHFPGAEAPARRLTATVAYYH